MKKLSMRALGAWACIATSVVLLAANIVIHWRGVADSHPLAEAATAQLCWVFIIVALLLEYGLGTKLDRAKN